MGDRASKDPEINEEFLERLRNDPDVIYHRQSSTEPFVPKIRLTAPVDELWLAGRREDHEVEPYLRGIDDETRSTSGSSSQMAQQTSIRPETSEEIKERLRNDPRVIYSRRTSTELPEPYEPKIRLTGPVDINWLIGRREDDEVEPYLRGIDE